MSEAEEHQNARTGTAPEEIKIISQQHTDFLKETVFHAVYGTVNVKRETATLTPNISSEDMEEADLLADMVDQLPAVPNTPISG